MRIPRKPQPVCPRCLGIAPGHPASQEDDRGQPLAAELCAACTAVTAPPAKLERPGSWRDLVWLPADENLLARRRLQLWTWRFNPHSLLLLKPKVVNGASTRKPVVVRTYKGTLPMHEGVHVNRDPEQFGDDVPTTTCTVWYAEGRHVVVEHAQEVPNGCMLRYLTNMQLGDERLLPYLSGRLPDETWDYTCEHPDFPGVYQPYAPCLFRDMPGPRPVRQKKAIEFEFD